MKHDDIAKFTKGTVRVGMAQRAARFVFALALVLVSATANSLIAFAASVTAVDGATVSNASIWLLRDALQDVNRSSIKLTIQDGSNMRIADVRLRDLF